MSTPLTAVLAAVRDRHANDPAIIQHQGAGEPRIVSFGALGALADRIACSRLGSLGPGETIGFFMRRSVEHVACVWAALGRVPYYSINPMLTTVQIAEMVAAANTRMLCVDNAGLLKLSRLTRSDLPGLSLLHLPDGPLNRLHEAALEKLAAELEVEALPEAPGAVSRPGSPSEGPALLLFTSGSTGTPRGVMIGHADLSQRVETEAAAFEIRPGDRLLNVLPFSFDVGCNQLLSSLARGATLVIVNSWLAGDIVSAAARYAVTGVSAVPAIWNELFKHDASKVSSALGSLRYLTISAGDLTEEGHDRLCALVPEAAVYKTYGQTETFRSAMLMPAEYAGRRTSVGRPPHGVRIHVVSDAGERAAPGEEGEIVHVGAGTMLGYVGDAEATAGKLRPSDIESESAVCVYTGDRGKVDAEGYLYVLGRADRMLKIRGNRVYPEEIERQLMRHPAVEAAVVIPRIEAGEIELVAGLELAEDSTDSEAEIGAFLARQLPSYMLPKRVRSMKKVPRTSTGKVDLSAARAEIEALDRD